jgi:murein DD-endopeptidase MepM/ murein hydrolase activator NlpD
LQSLLLNQTVTTSTPLGIMGDTGNAAGTPQLHAEIHYPAGSNFTCTHCTPNKVVTSIDPEPSLMGAAKRA